MQPTTAINRFSPADASLIPTGDKPTPTAQPERSYTGLSADIARFLSVEPTPCLRALTFRAVSAARKRMGGRVVECARLESVLGLKSPRGFESLPIRQFSLARRAPGALEAATKAARH
jgi:hypothetical protein